MSDEAKPVTIGHFRSPKPGESLCGLTQEPSQPFEQVKDKTKVVPCADCVALWDAIKRLREKGTT